MMARHLSCCLLCLLQNANQLSWPINCHFINDQQYVDVGLLCCHTFTASSHIITANSHFIQQNPKQLSPRYRAAPYKQHVDIVDIVDIVDSAPYKQHVDVVAFRRVLVVPIPPHSHLVVVHQK